ncbi:hypothetical protein MHU86_22520 [Fragilaria crotonensis]|nr:hypothetical protein MHU86_22520 [Fragilaria crotonensis]
MVQKSRDSVRHNTLVGLNGETCYVLLTDHYSGRILARLRNKGTSCRLDQQLARQLSTMPRQVCPMDGGGELGKCRDIHRTFANFGYIMELTGPDSSHQNGPGTPTSDDWRCSSHHAFRCEPTANFWPYAFYHYIRIYNFVPHGDRPSSPYEMCGAPLPNLAKLRTFGCRIHVRPNARYGRVVPNSRLGIFSDTPLPEGHVLLRPWQLDRQDRHPRVSTRA